MLKKHLVARVNSLLVKYQFQKRGAVWSRECDDFVDVIDLQIGKSQDTFTINIGVAEKSVAGICWGFRNSSAFDEPSCTVRARLGVLMCGRDIWWRLSDEASICEALSGVENAAIPFLESNHNIDHMIDMLESSPSGTSYPPEAIYIALLYNRRGDVDRSQEMLRALEAKVTGGWHQKVTDVLSALN